MRLRELAGEINRAKEVYVWVPYGADGVYICVPKVTAKLVLEDAKEKNYEEVEARVERGEVYIGSEVVDTTDGPWPAGEGGEDDGEETETEEEETEEEDDPT